MSDEGKGNAILAGVAQDVLTEFPSFRAVRKEDSKLMKLIDVLLRVLTFGQMKTFMSGYTTTIGTTVYTPSDWAGRDPLLRAITLRHERVHMRQRERFGAIGYALLYLLFPLPIGFAWGRTYLEGEAYEETLRAYVDYYGPVIPSAERERIIGEFTGPAYFWMWPFRRATERWYDAALSRIVKTRSSVGPQA